LRDSRYYHQQSPPVQTDSSNEASSSPANPNATMSPLLKKTFSFILESWIHSGVAKISEDLRPIVSTKFFDYLESLRKNILPLPQ
ncbi:hypothetical protein OFN56_37590, partial [Escherichia coli]|nr:hypothetical protein [Escherichia coli]